MRLSTSDGILPHFLTEFKRLLPHFWLNLINHGNVIKTLKSDEKFRPKNPPPA